MAWRSSGTNNDELVDNLKRFGVIHSPHIEDAFRCTDRRFFVPPDHRDSAYQDNPLRQGQLHISAPHIYGTVLEALELKPNSSFSFLNAGSGTGYLSSMVAHILGPTSLSINIDCHQEALEHGQQAVAAWKATREAPLAEMQFLLGNVLQIETNKGECLRGFDRIYVGATLEKSSLPALANLLKVGGILVGPVDDELVKVVRVGKGLGNLSPSTPRVRIPRSFRGQPPPLSDEFYQQTISAVLFTPLVQYPAMPVTIPSKVWSPAVHSRYPENFRKASGALLLCSHAPMIQPPLAVRQERVNVAPMLPRAIWAEILSYTHRDWFEQSKSNEDFLRRRLIEEQAATKTESLARLDAEAKLHLAERERDVYRLLALRWQTRLQAAVQESGGPDLDNGDLIGLEDVGQVAAAVFADEPTSMGLGGLNLLLRRFQAQPSTDSDDSDDSEDSDHQGQMEDDESEDDSVAMEDETETAEPMAVSPPRSQAMIMRSQTRTVSISNEDL